MEVIREAKIHFFNSCLIIYTKSNFSFESYLFEIYSSVKNIALIKKKVNIQKTSIEILKVIGLNTDEYNIGLNITCFSDITSK